MTRQRALGFVAGVAGLLAVSSAALGQGSDSMSIDIGKLAPNLEPDFAIWRTGQGGPAQWGGVADPTGAGGQGDAQA